MISFSSDYVFDGQKGTAYVESDATNPLGAYARTKLAGEREALAYEAGMVFRTAWLYSSHNRNFVKTILSAARRQLAGASTEPLRVVDDQVGSPTNARHLALAVDEALRIGVAPGLYHMAGAGYCSWCELTRESLQLAGFDLEVVPITTAEAGRPAPRPAFSALESERPIPQLPDWLDGLTEVVDELQENDWEALA